MPAVYGTVVILDLDRFKEYTIQQGFNAYKPNIVTGTLSHLVLDVASKRTGSILYGLDWDRGTEEAIIVFPGMESLQVKEDLLSIAKEICELGASITIVALHEAIITPGRVSQRKLRRIFKREFSILERLKHRGGGLVYIDGEIFHICKRPCLGIE